jgi:hypothetical protein
MAKRYGTMKRLQYDGNHMWELLWGPRSWDPKALSAGELCELWENGGRKAFEQDHFQIPGERAWAFWTWDVSAEDLHRAAAAGARCQAEWILFLGLDRPGERALITPELIERQIRTLEEREQSWREFNERRRPKASAR